MGKVFVSNPELDNVRVYAVTRLINDYAHSDYDEPGSKLTDNHLAA